MILKFGLRDYSTPPSRGGRRILKDRIKTASTAAVLPRKLAKGARLLSRPLFIALLLTLSGCVGTVSFYSSEKEREEFAEMCAAMETEHIKAAERGSTLVAVIASTTRFECARPRLWIKVDGPVKSDVIVPPELPRDPGAPSVEEAAREQGLRARHRAEVEDLNRWLREHGHEPGITPPMARSDPNVLPSIIFRRPGGSGLLGEGPRTLVLPDGTQLVELQSPRVDYPVEARKARLQGVVEVAYSVAPDGSVSRVELVRSAHPLLDQAALDAIALARYAPRPAPEARAVRLTRPVTFSIP